MIKFFKYGCIILLSIYATACGEEVYENNLSENIPTYEISPLQATSHSIHDVVSNYEFISLNIPNDLILENIRKVIFRDSKIYVLDTNSSGYRAKISVYDSSGSFQFVIDRSGRGPGEYELIHDFDLTDNNIVVIANANILYYDRSSGRHTNTVENNFDGNRIQWGKFFDNKSGVFAAGRGRANRSKNHLKFFETSSNSIFHEAVPFGSHSIIIGGSYRFLFETNQGLNARPVNSNVVYNIQSGQDSITVDQRYALDFDDLWIPESFLRTSFSNMGQIFDEGLYREYVHTVDLFETKKNLYATYTYDEDRFAYIYDKETDRYLNIFKFSENEISWPMHPLTTYNEWIVGAIYPFEIEAKDSQIDPALQEEIEKINSDGDPILVLVNFNLNY